jgi:hypothetical protein
VVEEALPGGESGERERCALDMCEAPRDGRVFGRDAVTVERRQREDLVVLGDATRGGPIVTTTPDSS